jgi:hypothetical protein
MASKFITTVGRVAAGAAALSLVAAATTASADPYRYRHHHSGRGGDVATAAIAAGIVGLAVGAAISDNDHRDRRYYDRGYSDRRYYAPPPPRYGYGYGYGPRPYYGDRECWTTREYDRWNGSYYERTVCR